MSWVAVAVGGAALVTSMVQADSANNARNQQNQAANRANAVAGQQYAQERADQEPWRQVGMRALSGLEGSEFQQDFDGRSLGQDPGYQFRLQEGMKALQGSAAAKGSLNSGGTLKALSRYGQDVASEEYNNAYNRFNADKDRRFNRLASLAGLGQTANAQVGQAGQSFSNAIGQNAMAQGNANAASSIAQGNAINNGVSQGMNTWMNYQAMNRFAPKAGG